MLPVEILREAIESYAPYLQASGEMHGPALSDYWGHRDLDPATEVCQSIIDDYAGKIDGIKVSLLDASREVEIRRRLPDGVRMYTGDDFDYLDLMQGDEQGFSHALLGIFDAIAPAASAALQALDAGDTDRYEEILAPTVLLSRHNFQSPTRYYKTGVVFLAYINGHQGHFRMVGGQEGARSVTHLSELFVLADRAGLLHEPDLARLGTHLRLPRQRLAPPKSDLLLSRAMMGDGPIQIRRIREAGPD